MKQSFNFTLLLILTTIEDVFFPFDDAKVRRFSGPAMDDDGKLQKNAFLLT